MSCPYGYGVGNNSMEQMMAQYVQYCGQPSPYPYGHPSCYSPYSHYKKKPGHCKKSGHCKKKCNKGEKSNYGSSTSGASSSTSGASSSTSGSASTLSSDGSTSSSLTTNSTSSYSGCKGSCPAPIDLNDLPELIKATKFDVANFAPSVLNQIGAPGGIPPIWTSNVIPANTGDPNATYYGKFQSVNYSLGFFFDVDMFTVDSTDPNLSVFLTDLEDRGFDSMGDNYKKRAYMWAFNCQNTKKYSKRMDKMLNAWYSDIVVNRKGVLKSFNDQVIRFLLNVHIGDDNYPDYVLKYFQFFADIVGFGDPTTPGRDEKMLFGHANTPCVREYFFQRKQFVMENDLDDTIVYHWTRAGVPTENLVMETIHNMIAFIQLNNTMFRIVRNQLYFENALVPPPSNPLETPVVNYFDKYNQASNEMEKLNLVREIFRLEVPNNGSFSREYNGASRQSIHVHQPIMIVNSGGIPQYRTYDTSKYNQFKTSFSQCQGQGQGHGQYHCPGQSQGYGHGQRYGQYHCQGHGQGKGQGHGQGKGQGKGKGKGQGHGQGKGHGQYHCQGPECGTVSRQAEEFVISPVDNETVLPSDNTKMIPVYPSPIYAPFGLGYRRCAGEVFVYLFTLKLLNRISNLKFRQDGTITTPTVPLAPFTVAPNNIFVQQPLE